MPPRRLVILAEVPAECPRRSDGGDGPRCCAFTSCRYHRLLPPSNGPYRPVRIRAGDDMCDLDRIARGPLELSEIGAYYGVSTTAARNVLRAALIKVADALELSLDDVERLFAGTG